MDGQPADAAAAKAVSVDTLLSLLNAAFSQFLSPEIVGKTILAAGRAAGIDDATLKAKLYAMGAVVKDEQKAGKVKKPKGEGKGKGMSLYQLFITKHCAETRAEDAKHPLAPGEKRDGNRLKDAISAWSDLDKGKFEELYGDLVRELKDRQHKGEKVDVGAEIAKFEQARGMSASTVAKARHPPEELAGAKPAKKAKVEAAAESDEDDSDDDDDDDEESGQANGKKGSTSGSDSDNDEDSEEEPPKPAKPAPTPSKTKKHAAKAVPAAAAAPPAAKPAGKVKVKEEGKKKEKKEKKAEKKK